MIPTNIHKHPQATCSHFHFLAGLQTHRLHQSGQQIYSFEKGGHLFNGLKWYVGKSIYIISSCWWLTFRFGKLILLSSPKPSAIFSHGTQDVKEGLDFYISQRLGLAMTNVDHSDFTGTKVWGRTVRLGGGILHWCWAKRCFNMDPCWNMLNLRTCSPMISCFKPHLGMFELHGLHGEKWWFPTSCWCQKNMVLVEMPSLSKRRGW